MVRKIRKKLSSLILRRCWITAVVSGTDSMVSIMHSRGEISLIYGIRDGKKLYLVKEGIFVMVSYVIFISEKILRSLFPLVWFLKWYYVPTMCT